MPLKCIPTRIATLDTRSAKPPRPSAQARGYTSAWQKARSAYLKAHPYCVMCTKQGKRTLATVVDHIRPHRGDKALFWDHTNWQPLCGPHHTRDKAQFEARGYTSDVDESGWPTDKRHRANRS